MSEQSCTDCEDIKERYKEVLEEEQKQLIAFRGHATRKFFHPRFQPFTENEIENMIKLFILGVRKFHLTVGKNEPVIDVSLDGVRIECQIKEDATTSFAMINITVPFDCDLIVYLLSDENINPEAKFGNNRYEEKWINKSKERGNSTFSFVQELERLPEYLFWNIKFIHYDVDSRIFNFLKGYPHETTDDCTKCIEIKEELRAGFYKEMKKLTSFRGHGRLLLEMCSARYNINEWQAFSNDELTTLLKLIYLGIQSFNFTLSSDTELDAEYKGIQLKTSSVNENGMFKFIMELIIPEGAGTTLFEAKCLDSEDNVSSPPNIANTCFIRRYIKPRKIAWSVQLFVK